MSFRRRKSAWQEFLRKYGEELHACGIPEYLSADEKRFLVFLDHGYDEWGWFKNPHACFSSADLSNEQIARLAELVGCQVDSEYRAVVSRWLDRG